MRLLRYCSAVLLGILTASSAAAQPAPGDASFRVFLRGVAIGTAAASLTRVDEGWVLRGSSRLEGPLGLTVKRVEVRYDDAWKPRDMSMELSSIDGTVVVRSVFEVGTARTDMVRNNQTSFGSYAVSTDTIVLPNLVFSAFEALAARLSTSTPGAELHAFIVPQAEITIRLDSVTDEVVQTTRRAINAKHWRITFMNPEAPVPAEVWVDGGRLARFDFSGQSVSVVRDDVASVSSRLMGISRPNDEQLFIPANGFNLAATISRPAAGSGRLPAIILVGGSGPIDRDGIVAGIPVFGQLAGSLADAGYLVVRYDQRGVGLSGGRLEAATMTDFADDVRSIVGFLRKRKDVESSRIVVFGHSEGSSVGLLAASREKRIAALVMAGATATKGVDVILEQQGRLLEQSSMSPAERQNAIALQKRILNAVVTGQGWEQIPADVRRQADTPWYQSLLLFDPVPLFRKVQQPILIVHGELDRQTGVHHADELARMARSRAKGRGAELVKLPALNHLFVPATTGDVSEYAALTERTVSSQLAQAVVDWLQKTFSPVASH